MNDYDLWVDFTRMGDDGRLRTRQRNARPGFIPIVGDHVIFGCQDADGAVAKILSVDDRDGIQVQVLPGTVDENRSLLTPAH